MEICIMNGHEDKQSQFIKDYGRLLERFRYSCGSRLSEYFTMKIQIVLSAIFVTFFPICLSDQRQLKLELVQVLFRHGERIPTVEEYEVLHYIDQAVYQPLGLGQLTNNGKRQAYKVGRMLRKRYNNFLNETYMNEDIFGQSAELDRTQISLQLVFAGLYSKSEWDANLNWNPIPYRCAPEQLDVLFRQFKSKKYKKLLKDLTSSPEIKEKLDAFSDLIQLLKYKKEISLNETLALRRITSSMLINSRMNISLPSWYSDDLMSRLRQLTILYLDCMSFTAEMRRAIAGPLVKTFLERMNLDDTSNNPRKMYLYSGSDYNVAAVARAFEVDGFRFVDFSSTLILEKLRDSNGQLYVRIFEWDAINEKLLNRKMKECDEVCPVDNFLMISRKLIPSDKEMNYLLDDFQGQNMVDLYTKDPVIEKFRLG